MIPRWLLVAIVLVALGVFAADYAAQFIVDGHQSNPAITTVFGAIAGSAFLLARSDRGAGSDKSKADPGPGDES